MNHCDEGSAIDRMATESQDGMSKDKGSGASGAAPDESEPKVGYKKPPKDTRFKPGQSGNPNGRPKGSGAKRKNNARRHGQADRPPDLLPSDAIFLEEGRRLIRLTENGTSTDLPIEQVAMRSTYTSAAKGDPRAQKLVFDRNAVIEAMVRERRTALNADWSSYKERADQQLERIETGENDLHLPLPHPDDVVLSDDHDPKIIGPTNEAEQVELETLLAKRAHLMLEHAYVERFGPENRDEDERLQAATEGAGLDLRYNDTSGLTGAFLAISLLENNLIPPRTRWSRSQMLAAYDRALCISRRELEKLLTIGRKVHRIPLKRGELYPSAAFEIDLSKFADEAASLLQEALEKAQSDARAKERDQSTVDVPLINPDIIMQHISEHNLSYQRLPGSTKRDKSD